MDAAAILTGSSSCRDSGKSDKIASELKYSPHLKRKQQQLKQQQQQQHRRLHGAGFDNEEQVRIPLSTSHDE